MWSFFFISFYVVVVVYSDDVIKGNSTPVDCQFYVHKNGPDGTLVTGVELDMQLYYRIKCHHVVMDDCLFVSNCTVSPEDGSSSYDVIDQDGCSLDTSLYDHVTYEDDSTAGIVNPIPIRFRGSSSAVLLYCVTTMRHREYGKCIRKQCL